MPLSLVSKKAWNPALRRSETPSKIKLGESLDREIFDVLPRTVKLMHARILKKPGAMWLRLKRRKSWPRENSSKKRIHCAWKNTSPTTQMQTSIPCVASVKEKKRKTS